MFVKHYAPNHMPDPKGEWSLKENNSELHYGIRLQVNQFILVCNYTPNIRILAKAVLKIFCSQGCSYTNACVQKMGVTQPKIYGIGSKVNHFIYILICNYMPNIRILAKFVLHLFCSQGCSYTKCLCLKKGNKPTENFRIGVKVNQFIYTLVCNYMPHTQILAKEVLQLFCSQGCSYTKCLCLKKESNAQRKIYGIGSKVNHFIYTLVCNYMPNIRIIAKTVLQIFCSQGCSYTKCLCLKKGNKPTENFWNMCKS